MTDENDNLYIAMPLTDLTAMEYYTQMQEQADSGHNTGMLDPHDVALTYLDEVWIGHAILQAIPSHTAPTTPRKTTN